MVQSQAKQEPQYTLDTECLEKDAPTHITIKTERSEYCDYLYEKYGVVKKWEGSYAALKEVYKEKKCLFVSVEKNYRILRNFNITIGSEFIQTNETIKENIGDYLKKSNDLYTTLQTICTEIGTLKSKMKVLREQACKLEACRDDSCNKTQWEILSGEQSALDENSKSRTTYPTSCTDTKKFFNKLICMPKSLAKDADSLFKSSADVKGIHVFTNLGTLEPMRVKLAELAIKLNNHMQDSMKLRETDLKTVEEDLTKTIKESAKSNVSRFSSRSDFEGVKKALNIMCCIESKCDCIKDVQCESPNDDAQRLAECEAKICDICGKVKTVYCPEKNPQQRRQETQQEA